MSLADKPCYPSDTRFMAGTVEKIKEYQDKMEFAGLTFRERLIIALASNSGFQSMLLELSPGEKRKIEDDVHNVVATGILHQADAIIKQMEAH